MYNGIAPALDSRHTGAYEHAFCRMEGRASLAEPTIRSFFLVEDEALIRMMLIDMLEELGHSVVAEAASVDEALPLARDSAFDIAILDINLAGSNSAPIAEIIAERHIPFLYASGYAENGLPTAFNDRLLLRKPFQIDQLEKAIRLAMNELCLPAKTQHEGQEKTTTL